jgi:hypothetical protein
MKEERKLLTKIARQNGGMLKVEDVLEEARDEGSPLHKHFEWDDSEAAAQYRRQQARALIQKCKITLIDSQPIEIRAFVSLPTDRENGGGYRLTSEVMNDDSMKAELIRDIQLTIARWTQKLNLMDKDLAEAILDLDIKINRFVEERKAA